MSTYDLLNAKEKLDLEYRLGAWDAEAYQDLYRELKEKVDNGLDYDWLSLPVKSYSIDVDVEVPLPSRSLQSNCVKH